ncbi:nucleotidyl transferase AbiEii/AbiGii toxin family protein [Clostridium gasigenes]|uniref:Nucleotidyl transferase AbiEii toxin, Type IV TA system n=1 Tax=Clostridium gasigenes TaxID=94869 RepID=A0A1H0W628_9CLOT|nr:nucleotidyl transferase AbiEii/AbiGii toxin family protein [Clostridium gasigenes]MBU3106960.1 nucleotidyl transferase AbiEii/AbiGii toxin family protein [Clostridium gasigenes]SDP86194.1 Nucleotidyl transferase AbiEii toxin, Type IV TA system [Clostridium gasigenes]
MITKNAMQLKAFIKNKAIENKISAQLVMQNYMLERLLERISISKYQHNFILKGGFLIAAIVGLDSRATMDLDTTIKGLDLTHDIVRKVFTDICSLKVDDDIEFELLGVVDIREHDDYPGMRVSLNANYKPLIVPLSVDITTGDKITPSEIEYSFKLLFDDRTIKVMAYNLETILAEKLETVISRGVANTRPRDYYDIYALHNLRNQKYNNAVLKSALISTATKRHSINNIYNYDKIISDVENSVKIQGFWKKYQKDFNYAREISFTNICSVIKTICNEINIDLQST